MARLKNANVTLPDRCLSTDIEHLGNVEHVGERLALGNFSFHSLKQVFSDDRPVAFAGHRRPPAIELGLIP